MTNRGRSGVENPDATSRAISAARRLISSGLVGDPVLLEHERERAEGRGLDRVDADREERLVHLGDEVGPGEHEHLVAALERLAAEVVGAEVVALHPGAERAVEHQHALGERVEERMPGAAPDRASAPARIGHHHQVTWRSPGRAHAERHSVDSRSA